MTAHLDLDALADLLAEQDGGAPLPAHLQECAGCRARLAELAAAVEQVGPALAGLPAPTPPADVQDRVLAALAAERAATAAGPGPAGPAPAQPTTSQPTSSRPAPSRPTTVLPGSADRPRRPRWVPVAGGVAAAAVLVTAGVLLSRGSTSRSDRATSAPAAQIARSSTGNAYAKDGKALAAALPGLLKGDAPAAAGAATASGAGGPLTRTPLSSGAGDPLAALRGNGLAPCLASLSDPSDPGVPLALDYASFDGTPALVVVFPASAAGKVDVFVVGAGCNAQDAHVLFFTRLSKPA